MSESQSPAHGQSVVSWPGEAVAVALRRTAALLVGAWLFGFGVNDVLAGSLRYPLVVLALIGLGLASSVLVALRRRTDGRVLVVTSAATVMAVVLLADLGAGDVGALLLYWLTGIVSACAGLLMPPRAGLVVGLGFGAVFSAVLLLRSLPHDGLRIAVTAAVVSLGIAVCNGAAAVLLARALRGLGRAADLEMSRAEADREAQERAMRDRRDAVRLASRLHDGVVNTLSAVAVRGDALDPEAVRRASARSADEAVRIGMDRIVMDRIGMDDEHLAVDPGARLPWHQAGEASNPHPEVLLKGATPDELLATFSRLPRVVSDALTGGIHEALVNVVRHSGCARAWIELGPGPVVDLVVRDDGVGFDGVPVPGRGLAVSVTERCAAAGIDVRIVSALARGTEIRFRYDPAADPSSRGEAALDADQLLASARQPFATQLAICVLALCCCLTLVATAAPGASQSPGSWLGLALLAGVTWVGVAGSRRGGWMRTWQAGGVVLAVPALVLLPGLGLPGCTRVELAWWGPEGAMVPIILLVFLSRRWWPTALAVAAFGGSLAVLEWLVRDAGCDSPVISGLLDFPMVMAAVYFRTYLTRLAVHASAANADARRIRVAESGARSAHQAWRTQLEVVLRDAAALLRDIAEGRLAPNSEAVRLRCLLMETQVRQLTLLDPNLDPLEEHLVAVLAAAHRTGVRVVLRMGTRSAPQQGSTLGPGTASRPETAPRPETPDAEAAAAVRILLSAVVGACGVGDTVTVARIGPSSRPPITVTAPAGAITVCPALREPAAAAGWSLSWTDLGEQCLIELQQKEIA